MKIVDVWGFDPDPLEKLVLVALRQEKKTEGSESGSEGEEKGGGSGGEGASCRQLIWGCAATAALWLLNGTYIKLIKHINSFVLYSVSQ